MTTNTVIDADLFSELLYDAVRSDPDTGRNWAAFCVWLACGDMHVCNVSDALKIVGARSIERGEGKLHGGEEC